MTSQTGKQIISIHILSYISGSKGKQVMKFGQLIKDSMINVQLQKSYRIWGRETSYIPFLAF